jgi:PST family polysaccharide transporter
VRIGRRKLLSDSAILYSVHFANYIPPLILLPYLARMLGPFHLGLVASAQAVGAFVATLVDYGFTMTAARDVTRFRDDRARLTTLGASVTGAKLVLALIAAACVLATAFIVPVFRQHPIYLVGGLLFGVAECLRFDWFFLGTDQISRVGLPELVTRPLAMVTVMLIVTSPSRAWLVMIIQTIFAGVAMSWNLAWVRRHIDFEWPTRSGSWGALKSGWSLFLSRSSIALYMSSNTIVLGAFASQVMVSYYAGADKLVKGFTTSLEPLGRIIYPKVNHALLRDPQHAGRILRAGMAVFLAASASMAAVMFALCPWLIRIILGSQYLGAVPIAQVLSVLIFVTGLNQFLSYQWLLPFGLDRFLSRATLAAGVADIALCALLSRFFGGIGCAMAVVATEVVTTVYLYVVLRRHHLDPFSKLPLNFPGLPGAEPAPNLAALKSGP